MVKEFITSVNADVTVVQQLIKNAVDSRNEKFVDELQKIIDHDGMYSSYDTVNISSITKLVDKIKLGLF